LVLVFIVTACLACNRAHTTSIEAPERLPASAQTSTTKSEAEENICVKFDRLNARVRDGLIDKKAARALVAEMIPKLGDYFRANGGSGSPVNAWVFPVEGYNPKAIGGSNGSGYIAKGYDYFDGNRHGGHPAHDIFILDKNHDDLDDATGKPVKVLAMKSGVVVASANRWTPDSDLRGGKYVYVYDPVTKSLLYYAHNHEIFVKPGDMVTAGQAIATVGRSGKNAFQSRSPTHLHIMWLVFEKESLTPKDLYQILRSAKTSSKSGS
jgi:murein DD-endopeptidase MepM/ murein hydrolase activator NlpD